MYLLPYQTSSCSPVHWKVQANHFNYICTFCTFFLILLYHPERHYLFDKSQADIHMMHVPDISFDQLIRINLAHGAVRSY